METLRTQQAAGFFVRLAALFYDCVLVIALWLLSLTLFVAINNGAVFGIFFQGFLLAEAALFFVLYWVFAGKTLGMQAWKLKIISTNATPLTWHRGLLRFIIALTLISFFWILIDPSKRSIADIITKTQVIRVQT